MCVSTWRLHLKNALFLTMEHNEALIGPFTQAVTDLGANYAIRSSLSIEHTDPQEIAKWGKSHNCCNCQSVFLHGMDGKHLDVPKTVADMPDIEQYRHKNGLIEPCWVSSLDLDAGENREKMLCALDTFAIYYNAWSTELQLAGSKTKQSDRTVERNLHAMTGMEIIRKSFNEFVWQQLLKEGKVKGTIVRERELKVFFADLAVFLHYFALFSQPALKLMPQYLQSNLEGHFHQSPNVRT